MFSGRTLQQTPNALYNPWMECTHGNFLVGAALRKAMAKPPLYLVRRLLLPLEVLREMAVLPGPETAGFGC
jgi:hypothetical protein